jgi:hypothetical protein
MHEVGHVFPPSLLQLYQILEVEFTECEINQTFHTDFFRAFYLRQWLETRLDKFDRIFYFDAYDVFFQSDPFQRLVFPGSMTFVEEGVTVRHQYGNFRWIRNCIGPHVAEAMLDFPVICSGTVAGDTRAFYQYLVVLLSNASLWAACRFDQPQINYLAWSGEFERAGVPYQVQGCNGTVNGIIECPVNQHYFDGPLFDVAVSESDLPSPVAHHYPKKDPILRNYYARCGIEVHDQPTIARRRGRGRVRRPA